MTKQAKSGVRRAARESSPRGSSSVQYTVREVPPYVDHALRARARDSGKSLNQVVREALAREAGVSTTGPVVYDDLDHLAGAWREDPAFDQAIAAQDTVDEEMWR